MESVLEEYRASLEDLTFNSKPLINMLTVLAEENYSYASDLVKLIESQVYQVSFFPAMYFCLQILGYTRANESPLFLIKIMLLSKDSLVEVIFVVKVENK